MMIDEEVKYRPYSALKSFTYELTPAQLDYCVRKLQWAAIKYCANKLLDEQFDFCIARRKQNDR